MLEPTESAMLDYAHNLIKKVIIPVVGMIKGNVTSFVG